MSLANKYRPTRFSDCVEQKYVVQILQSMCDAGMPSRNLLLTGPAGCGKTTLGRLIAQRLNGSTSDVIEIDAASNNGVDAARDLVVQARAYPVGAAFKVIIMDEAHTLTNQAWQALLKVLEESPARTVFIFCTTNPEKIPGTILSRVQMFRLSRISTQGIHDRLQYVLDSERADTPEISYEDSAIWMIAKLACGGLRDSLTLLDKVLALSKTVSVETVKCALGLLNYDDFFSLLSAIAKKDNARIITIIGAIYESGVNFTVWFDQFHAFLLNVAKYVYLNDITETSIPDQYSEKMKSYTQTHAAICLRLAPIILRMNGDLRKSAYPQEIAMTYLCMQGR